MITIAIKKYLYLVLFIFLLVAATSCIPKHYYEPTSEGKQVRSGGRRKAGSSTDVLIVDIAEGVKSRIRIFGSQYQFYLRVGLIVPKGATVQLASDEFKIYSSQRSNPYIGKVVSIQQMKDSRFYYEYKYIKENSNKVLVPRLETFEKLTGFSKGSLRKNTHAFYRLHFIYSEVITSDIPVETISVHYPDFYINGVLVSTEPINFKWSTGIDILGDPIFP